MSQRDVVIEPIEEAGGLLSTVRNVELCAVGIEYPLASGPATFTPDDLLHAVASQDDPAIQSPRVWLGHPDDQRFHAGRTTPAGSAEPALGKVINMRVEDDGMVLVGDIVGCPTWLANILASAYPSRSVEGFQMAKTVTGREWRLVITDLALLGVSWPGVSTLEDLQALYSVEGPDNVEVDDVEPIAASAAHQISAQVELEKVRREFVAQLSDLGIPGYPWIRAVLQDPNELIVDDDEGGLYRLPYSTTASGDVEFGELQTVKVKYVNAAQQADPSVRQLAAAMLTIDHTVVASWDDRTASRPDNNDQEVTTMDAEKLRQSLGLPADATDEQVEQKLAELTAAAPSNEPAPPADEPTGEPVAEETPEPIAASAALPDGMVAVPAEAWADMQSQVQTITADRAQQQLNADLELIPNAIRAGKIFPHQRGHYEARLKDPNTRDAFRHLLTASVAEGGLAPNLVPVTARGVDPSTTEAQDASAYPSEWLPELQTDGASPITMES